MERGEMEKERKTKVGRSWEKSIKRMAKWSHTCKSMHRDHIHSLKLLGN